MGEVYTAEHLRLGRQFAVKLLLSAQEPRSRARFRREAEAIAAIENEHVVSVVDCGEARDGTPYLVMELLRGEDLRSLLRRERSLPVSRAVGVLLDTCRGLEAVHSAGLVHRDLKPENVFVTKRATGQDWCKILDFGVAKMETSVSTAHGAVIGTVKYMAPEQLQDGASVGPRTDIYALGALLYECLSGAPPHTGTTVHELMFKIMNEPTLDLRLLRPHVPRDLARAVGRALEKRAVDRFATVSEFAEAIAAHSRPEFDLGDMRAAANGNARTETRPMRHIRRVALVAAVAVIGLVSIAGTMIGSAEPAGGAFFGRIRPKESAGAQRPLRLQPVVESLGARVPAAGAPPSAVSVSVVPLPPASASGRSDVKSPRVEARHPISAPLASRGTFDDHNPYGE